MSHSRRTTKLLILCASCLISLGCDDERVDTTSPAPKLAQGERAENSPRGGADARAAETHEANFSVQAADLRAAVRNWNQLYRFGQSKAPSVAHQGTPK